MGGWEAEIVGEKKRHSVKWGPKISEAKTPPLRKPASLLPCFPVL